MPWQHCRCCETGRDTDEHFCSNFTITWLVNTSSTLINSQKGQGEMRMLMFPVAHNQITSGIWEKLPNVLVNFSTQQCCWNQPLILKFGRAARFILMTATLFKHIRLDKLETRVFCLICRKSLDAECHLLWDPDRLCHSDVIIHNYK